MREVKDCGLNVEVGGSEQDFRKMNAATFLLDTNWKPGEESFA